MDDELGAVLAIARKLPGTAAQRAEAAQAAAESAAEAAEARAFALTEDATGLVFTAPSE